MEITKTPSNKGVIFLAKKNKEKTLPLDVHLYDAGKVAVNLWDKWLSDSQKIIIANSIGERERARDLVFFLAYLHDIGKATQAFQEKIGSVKSTLLSPEKSLHALAGQVILEKEGIKEDISNIIGAHHGLPIQSKKEVREQESYKENYGLSSEYSKKQKELIQNALKFSNFKKIEDLPNISQTGQVLLTGLIITADWIASNEEFFPLIIEKDLDKRAKRGFDKWIKTQNVKKITPIDIKEDFKKRFGFYPNQYQENFIKTINSTTNPGVFIFEAPMGIGKTEAALYGVEELINKKGLSGMFFGLPTQATSNGIFPRVKSWLESLSKDTNVTSGLRLLHGKASLNEDFANLSSGINLDSKKEETVILNSWFSGKKSAIMDDFVIGTIDQLLSMSLKQRHLFLKHLGFTKKVVVIDEVHAYDSYMDQYLEKSLKWLGAYDVPVIILSATLPAEKRKELIESYIKGKGAKSKDIIYDEIIEDDSYPLITYTDDKTIKYECDFKLEDDKNFKIEKYDEKDLYSLIEELYSDGGNIGIIVNTVNKAQSITKAIKSKFGNNSVFLIHSRFIDTDRAEKEKQLLSLVGKKGDRPNAKIYIGTQVMEQSLDIDFDVLITDLCPMDLLIQRLGRLHRHNRERLKAYKNPCMYVIGCNNDYKFDKGSTFVYSSYILARTQFFLPDEINIPKDVSKLVQLVYNENNEIKNVDEFKEDYTNTINDKKIRAKIFQIGNPSCEIREKRKKTLIGWLNGYDSRGEDLAVRDIGSSLEVVVVDGKFLKNQNISYKEAKDIAKKTIRLPNSLIKKDFINKLEIYRKENLEFFKKSSWLKNSYGISFNNGSFILDNYILNYDKDIGLSFKIIYNK